MVQWGVDQAKQLGLPAYVEATVEGQLLYEKNGFKPVDAVVVRKERTGRPEDVVYVTLIHDGGSGTNPQTGGEEKD